MDEPRLGTFTPDQPAVIVPVQGDDATCRALAEQLAGQGADFLEWRVDTDPRLDIKDGVELLRRALTYRHAAGLPVLATFRTKREGGARMIGARDYSNMVQILASECAVVDVEEAWGARVIQAARAACRQYGAELLASYHNFGETPAGLWAIFARLQATGADVVKVAVQPESERDVARLEYAAKGVQGRPVIAIAMGELGEPTRLYPGRVGGIATFAALPGHASAPGQLELSTVLATWGRIPASEASGC